MQSLEKRRMFLVLSMIILNVERAKSSSFFELLALFFFDELFVDIHFLPYIDLKAIPYNFSFYLNLQMKTISSFLV